MVRDKLPNGEYILEMQHITKDFSGVKALEDVTFRVKRGEVHALVGENGAGKSTLMKIMSGVYPKGTYTGKIILDGEEKQFSNIKNSEKSGIVIIYQELGLIHSMTICENVFLGNEIINNGYIDWNAQFIRCRELLKQVKLEEEIQTVVGNLGTGKQQLIEIAKALSKDVKILILDEPTASLTEEDSKNLLKLIGSLKEEGITCIFISHKLSEVMSIADTITVLRDGKTVISKQKSEMTQAAMVSYMVGRELVELYPRQEHTIGEVYFEVEGLSVDNPENPNKKLLDNVNIKVRKGEIVGIAGLMGAGRTEMALAVYGALSAKAKGNLIIEGTKFKLMSNPSQAIKHGIGYVTEDRKENGLVLSNDIKTNLTISSLDKMLKNGIINSNLENKKAKESIEQFNVKASSMFQTVGNLSGGNQQKVVLGKTIMAEPKILFLDEPTRGIDVGSKYEIYQLINKLLMQGISIVVISSELPEVIGISDRIYVMCEGRIAGELDFSKDEITQEKLLKLMAGGE